MKHFYLYAMIDLDAREPYESADVNYEHFGLGYFSSDAAARDAAARIFGPVAWDNGNGEAADLNDMIHLWIAEVELDEIYTDSLRRLLHRASELDAPLKVMPDYRAKNAPDG